MFSRRLLIGSIVVVTAICVALVSSNRKAEAEADMLKRDKERCRELTKQIIDMHNEHIEVLERNKNNPESSEVVQFRQRLTPVLVEYGQLQRRHPEWEGRPFMAPR
jgi:hypothetical protein